MANTKSAIKTIRRIARQTAVNKSRKSRFRNAIKKMNTILDTKNKNEIEIIKSAPKIKEFYTKEDQSHFKQVQEYLKALSIPFSIDPLLVRGLDYYTQTTFEIISNDIGAQDALLGGGRYDGLIMSLGGKDTPAVGFAAGMERILLAINKNNNNKSTTPTIYIVCVENDAISSMQQIAKDLRGLGIKVLLETLRRSMKAQMKDAHRLNAKYVILIGENEINNQSIIIKDMKSGEQNEVPADQFLTFFNNINNA